jgi:hypothetical protein
MGSGGVERRPAPILFKPASSLLARIIQEPPRDVLPDRAPAIEAHGIDGLDLHGPVAAPAGGAQHVPGNLRKLSLAHQDAVGAGARILQD